MKFDANNIEVNVKARYAPELCVGGDHSNVYVYKVRIKNNSSDDIKLLSRVWHIIQEDCVSEVIKGEGVVGRQPLIKSGGEFEYASQAVLFAESGLMYGHYLCVNLNTLENIEVQIPAFSLDKIL